MKRGAISLPLSSIRRFRNPLTRSPSVALSSNHSLPRRFAYADRPDRPRSGGVSDLSHCAPGRGRGRGRGRCGVFQNGGYHGRASSPHAASTDACDLCPCRGPCRGPCPGHRGRNPGGSAPFATSPSSACLCATSTAPSFGAWCSSSFASSSPRRSRHRCTFGPGATMAAFRGGDPHHCYAVGGTPRQAVPAFSFLVLQEFV